MKEYIIWGISPVGKEEEVLASEHAGIKSMAEAEAAIHTLEKYGCKECRIQVIDFAKKYKFYG